MNTPRKNPDFSLWQEAPTPRNEVEVIALKSVLLYYLKCFIASQYKAENDSFIDFSQSRKSPLSSEMTARENSSLRCHAIPLQKEQDGTRVLYSTALPQLLKSAISSPSNPTFEAVTFQKTAHSFTQQLQAFQLQSLVDNSSCTEATLSCLSNLWKSFKIATERPGWISFRLSNLGIFTWINQLQTISQMAEENHTIVIKKLSLEPVRNGPPSRPASAKQQRYVKAHADQLIWQTQYTYARCCSIMRNHSILMMKENFSEVKRTKINQEEVLSALELIFQQKQLTPTHQLIQTLVATTDDMSCLPEQQPDKQYFLLLKRAERLNIAFDQFHRANGLVPNASQQFPYLILINSTRNLLKLLLHSYLQVPAPTHL